MNLAEMKAIMHRVRELWPDLDMTGAQLESWKSFLIGRDVESVTAAVNLAYAANSRTVYLDRVMKFYDVHRRQQVGHDNRTRVGQQAEDREKERQLIADRDRDISGRLQALHPDELQAAKDRCQSYMGMLEGLNPAEWSRFGRSIVWECHERIRDEA